MFFNERLNSVSNTCQQNISNAVIGVNNTTKRTKQFYGRAENEGYTVRALNNVSSRPHLMMPGSVKCVY